MSSHPGGGMEQTLRRRYSSEERPAAYIANRTGQVVLDLRFLVYSRISREDPSEGHCHVCGNDLDPDELQDGFRLATFSWIGPHGVPHVQYDGKCGELVDVCTDCDDWLRRLNERANSQQQAISDFRFEERELVWSPDIGQVLQVVEQFRTGIEDLAVWWPIYGCHVAVEVDGVYIAPVEGEQPMYFNEDELEPWAHPPAPAALPTYDAAPRLEEVMPLLEADAVPSLEQAMRPALPSAAPRLEDAVRRLEAAPRSPNNALPLPSWRRRR
jgi:hypothetical protein